MRRVRRSLVTGSVALAVLFVAAPGGHAATSPLRTATTTGNAEIEETIPITRHAGTEPRVVISLGPHQMPTFKKGDRLHGLGEVQVTNTCAEPGPRCIGRRYSFSPHVSAWLVLARGRHATGGSAAKRISPRERVTCGQHRPNRNHHCVLVFRHAGMKVHRPARLPCRPDRCHLNLVLAAHHSGARHGNRLIVGADRPDGSVAQGKGRVSALLIRPGAHPDPEVRASSSRVHHSVPMSEGRSGGWVATYSVKLVHLHAGDVITVDARQIFDISGLGHAAFDSNELVLTQGRRKAHAGRIARRSARPGPALSEANGFNCTHGPSAYRTPCVSRKVGQVTIKREPVNHRGRAVPLYVNLLCRGLIKGIQKGGQAAAIRRGGFLRVTHYRAS